MQKFINTVYNPINKKKEVFMNIFNERIKSINEVITNIIINIIIKLLIVIIF